MLFLGSSDIGDKESEAKSCFADSRFEIVTTTRDGEAEMENTRMCCLTGGRDGAIYMQD